MTEYEITNNRITEAKRIAELEKENAELRNNGFTVSAMTEQQLKVALEKGEQLEKENAELKCECRRCVYTDSPCILSDYGKDRNGICDHFKDVFDENAELRIKLEALDGQTPWKDIKDKSELIEKLVRAKALLKWFVWYFKEDYNYVPYKQKVKEAEQFLKGKADESKN